MLRHRSLLVALTLVLVAALAAPALAQDTAQIIVRRDPGLPASARADVRADADARLERRMLVPDSEVVTVPADRVDEALAQLNADPRVRYAERDGRVRAAAAPVTGADTYWSLLWGLHNTGQSGGLADADVDAPEAWAAGADGTGATVAVVDSGVDQAHADLAAQTASNAGEQGTDAHGADRRTNGVDDDADGLVDNWRGWDWVEDDNLPQDLDDHGTHVSGTIAATNGNGTGISGVAPNARILALRVLDATGSGDWSDVADAFEHAGRAGVRIVNASLGGQGNVQIVNDAIARNPGTLYVVAAGNDNLSLDGTTYTPCEAPAANVVCVGATTRTDVRASFSNYSPTAVDLMAPGDTIASTVPGGGYVSMNGTSMATPHVAGVAALVLGRTPGLSTTALKDRLLTSTDTVAALSGAAARGRINAHTAVTAAAPADADGDGVLDASDNCPSVANATQADLDGDGTGDACDADRDGDGVANAADNCASVPNPDQADLDRDALGDACDPDRDGDGVANATDNCPSAANADQADADGDLVGDVCDATPRPPVTLPPVAPPDRDGDGLADAADACPDRHGGGTLDGCPFPVLAPRPPETRTPVTAPADDPPAAPTAPVTTPPHVPAQLTGVRVGLKRCTAPKRCGRATLTVSARVAGAAARMRVELTRKRCVERRCRWVAAGGALTARAARADQRVTATLRVRGQYRVKVTAADAAPVTRAFFVR